MKIRKYFLCKNAYYGYFKAILSELRNNIAESEK